MTCDEAPADCAKAPTGDRAITDENGTRPHRAVDHRSFRDQLAFSIGFGVTHSRELLRRLLKDHVTDDARAQLAERVVEHLEQAGFEIDEGEQIMRRRPPTRNHG
jgi:hypothetical protein